MISVSYLLAKPSRLIVQADNQRGSAVVAVQSSRFYTRAPATKPPLLLPLAHKVLLGHTSAQHIFATMDSKVFQHQPLDIRTREIRLLTVLPTVDTTIRCRLKIFSLDDPSIPEYRALSYTWGPPPSASAIQVNDKSFLVRQNLYNFLETFRARLVKFAGNGYFEGETQWLWIDQICIDQSTIRERNHQVEMMADIYRRACYVYLWLGASSESTERVVRAMKATFRLYHHHTTRSLMNQDVRSSLESAELPPLSQRDLVTFFQNPYWERLWIVQEVMLARYIRIFFGDKMVSWEELKRFCTIDQNLLLTGACVQIPEKLLWLASNAQTGKTFSFPVLFDIFGSSLCADPSDRAYALLGIVHPEEKIRVEYGKSDEDMFADALKMILPTSTQSPRSYFNAVIDQDYTMPKSQIYTNAALAMMDEARHETGLRYMEAIIILSSQMDIQLPHIGKNGDMREAYATHAIIYADAYDAASECTVSADSTQIMEGARLEARSNYAIIDSLKYQSNRLRGRWERLGRSTFEVYHGDESARPRAQARMKTCCEFLEAGYREIIGVTKCFLDTTSKRYLGEDIIDLEGIRGRSHESFWENMHALGERAAC
ncbi:unnamed protein product [Periconia digitata]|uniref:Heterokaryon incompatibility domain-containing protein n=1 Tax=Periconia digitata TaxID=1303443 RepID=A0A9W4UCS6_9PLEO|nr:unnamed protein product [Periconia digitata]